MSLSQSEIILAALFLLLASLAGQAAEAEKPPLFHLENPSPKADYDRLPVFYTSDPKYDEFANEWFMRHLSVDPERAIYGYGKGVILGCTNHLWCVEWDSWYLPWIDRGAMGTERQGGNDIEWQYYYLLNVPMDKYGYVWGAIFFPEPTNHLGGWVPLFGWPWPKYNRDTTVTRPHGWEFNDPADGARDEWIAADIELSPGYVDHSLAGMITGPRPEFISPKFDVDVFQVPIIELDITYKAPEGKKAAGLVDGLKIYWKTSDSPRFTEDKMVTVDFCDLPPKRFPGDYAGFASETSARYPLFFPMCMHPKWGREGRRITQLKIVPVGEGTDGVTVSVNYVRASYDVRLYTTNAIVINTAYRYFMWHGDEEFLKAIMPRLRKAMIYMNEHLGGRKHGLIHSGWMVGKEGLGGEVGRSVYSSYWDLLPSGVYDIESSVSYYSALLAMADLERICKSRGISVPDVSVLGPDNKTMLTYRVTPEWLRAHAKRVKARIEDVFWMKETGRFCKAVDVKGGKHDYGFVHFNVWALAQGIGTKAQRESVLSWFDGSRTVPGDTAAGKDIYHWRFGPRTSTRRNESWYYWPWMAEWKTSPPEWQYSREWGNQYQDGGAAPMTGFFDLLLRTSTGRQKDIDEAFQRTKEIQAWYEDVKSAGGQGQEFYRKYYGGHPERGIQQSPMPGGLGLDHEFLSDGSLETAFIPFAFLGLRAEADKVLSVTPAVPSQLEKIGVRNVFYRGNHLTIEAGRNYVSLDGSRIPNGKGLEVRITFRNAPSRCKVLVSGKPYRSFKRDRDGSVTVLLPLSPVRVEVGRGADFPVQRPSSFEGPNLGRGDQVVDPAAEVTVASSCFETGDELYRLIRERRGSRGSP